jgi:NDP-sugar pyrophosphorylase family protein
MLETLSAVLLVGGLGTRLRSVAPLTPKPLVPVAGRPFLEWVVDWLRGLGCRDLVLSLGHRGEDFVRHFGDGDRFGVVVRYAQEATPLGTAGAVLTAAAAVRSDPFLVLNGDSYCPCDLRRVAASHQARAAEATLVVTEVPDAGRYGRVELDDAGRVSAFREKEAGGGPGSVNAGIYVVNRAALSLIPPGKPCSLEREVFPALCGKGLYGFPVAAPFLDIGTPEALQAAQTFFLGESRRERGGEGG